MTKTKQTRVALYARVSTGKQSIEMQLTELREVAERRGWRVVNEFTDKAISGKKGRDQRPQFDAMMKAAVRREFDFVAAWHIDRMGRSVQQVAAAMEELNAVEVSQYYHAHGMDSSTPYGKAMLQMAMVFAELEHAVIKERIMAGLAHAKKHGTKSGRPSGRPTTPEIVKRKILEHASRGLSIRKIAARVDVSRAVVQRTLALHNSIAEG